MRRAQQQLGTRDRLTILIGKVDENMGLLNKQSRQRTRCGPPAWRMGEGLSNLNSKKKKQSKPITKSYRGRRT
jgi:hypothetical protein